MKKTIKVSCAIIYNKNNEILISQRSKTSKLHPLEWEFLGGKFEPNENGEQCIIREIKEEINLDILNPKLIHTQTHNYDYADVYLEFFEIKEFSGELKVNVHEQILWEKIENLHKYNFVKGDLEIIEMLKRQIIKNK